MVKETPHDSKFLSLNQEAIPSTWRKFREREKIYFRLRLPKSGVHFATVLCPKKFCNIVPWWTKPAYSASDWAWVHQPRCNFRKFLFVQFLFLGNNLPKKKLRPRPEVTFSISMPLSLSYKFGLLTKAKQNNAWNISALKSIKTGILVEGFNSKISLFTFVKPEQ